MMIAVRAEHDDRAAQKPYGMLSRRINPHFTLTRAYFIDEDIFS